MSPEKNIEERTDKFRKRAAKAIAAGIDVRQIVDELFEQQELVAPAAMTRAEKDVKAREDVRSFVLTDPDEL